jgi:arylsulfatase
MLRFLLFSIIIVLTISCAEEESSNPKKTNIIYILADDLGYGEVGAFGQSKIETPNIDALAKDGMRFTQHYSGAPVCAPARCVLLTGKHTGHSYVRGNDEWRSRGDVWSYKAMIKDSTLEGQRPMPEETITIAKLLKEGGYKTGMIGKWGLGAPNTNSIPTKMGFDYFFGYNCQRIAHQLTPVHMYENEKRYYLDNDTIPPGTGLGAGADPMDRASYAKYEQPEYAPEVSFDKLMNFVRESKEDPFFLYWATPIPHVPLQAPRKWVDYYVEKFGDEEPYHFEGKGSYFPTRYPHATYAAMISYLDENIGKLVDYLKEEEIYENTLIVFTSDNGPSYVGGTDSPWFESGGPFESVYGRGKGFVHEGGIRVPMIATWPAKIKAGSESDHISAFWDALPTLCEVAEVEVPTSTDGISFYKAMMGDEEQEDHEFMYWEFPAYGGQVAIRMGKWKIIWKDINKGNKEVEVYNLEEDIQEQSDVAADHPELVKDFHRIIKETHTTPEIERFQIKNLEEFVSD